MICRQNYLDVKQWMQYQREVRQLATRTIDKRRGSIRHLLEWADDVPFTEAHKIRPVYPVYLQSVPVVRNEKPMGCTLSKTTQELACKVARRFYTWARRVLSQYRSVDPLWIETLKPGRLAETVKERELYTLDEVLTITRPAPDDRLKVQRDKAAVAFLFLSGMRIGAFVTLPIMAVDLDNLTIKQWPELGVATKNRKAATTYLLNIPELLNLVRVWDNLVRSALSPRLMWYSRLRYDPMTDDVLLEGTALPHFRYTSRISTGLKDLCQASGVQYKSPHKLRHGHAVYALQRARTIADFKAVSQNLMHASLGITDQVYGVLTGDDVQSRIASLADTDSTNQQEVIQVLESLLAKAKQGM